MFTSGMRRKAALQKRYLQVECPRCGAPPGHVCYSKGDFAGLYGHVERRNLADKLRAEEKTCNSHKSA